MNSITVYSSLMPPQRPPCDNITHSTCLAASKDDLLIVSSQVSRIVGNVATNTKAKLAAEPTNTTKIILDNSGKTPASLIKPSELASQVPQSNALQLHTTWASLIMQSRILQIQTSMLESVRSRSTTSESLTSLEQAVLEWIIDALQPFVVVERPSFRHVFESIQQDLPLWNNVVVRSRIISQLDDLYSILLDER